MKTTKITSGLIVLSLFISLFILSGCATTIRVPVTRPAEINLRGINKIAIGEIKGDGGQTIADLLSSKLFESQKFEVVDRAHIQQVMAEHKLNKSGIVDEKTALQLGKYVGAAVLVFGNVSLNKYEQKMSKANPWRDKEGGRHQTHYIKGTAKLTTTLQVIGLNTGKVLASKTISKTAENTNSADNGWPEEPDKDALMSATVNDAVNAFIKMIAPYRDYESVTFAKKDSDLPELEKCESFAKMGRWNDAVEQAKIATQKNPTNVGAWWNLGICYQFSYMFTEAESAFNEAYKIKPEEKYLIQISQVKRLASERKRLDEQGELQK